MRPKLAQLRHVLLAGGIAGFVIGLVPDVILGINPGASSIMQSPVLIGIEISAALVTVAVLITWLRVDSDPLHRAFAVVLLGVGVYAGLFQSLAVALGWWRGTALQGTLVALGLGGQRGAFGFAAHLGVVFVLYWLVARRWPGWGVALYAVFLLALIPGTIYSDHMDSVDGSLVFRHGYMVGADLAYAYSIFLMPFALFEWVRRRKAVLSRLTRVPQRLSR